MTCIQVERQRVPTFFFFFLLRVEGQQKTSPSDTNLRQHRISPHGPYVRFLLLAAIRMGFSGLGLTSGTQRFSAQCSDCY